GTMGLPHVLVRFYTNPDGAAARRTAVFVLALLGCLYLAVTLLGVLSRLYTPQLLVNGDTDAAVLLLPTAVLGSVLAGALLGALVVGAARGPVLPTLTWLSVRMAGVQSTGAICSSWTRDFRLAAGIAGGVPLALELGVTRLDFGEAVALVFAVAASTF